MSRDSIPNDFTLSLVIVDSIPVILFMFSILFIGVRYNSILFVLGASLIIFAGICKVLWKLIVVIKKKSIWFLFVQMRISMPIGFCLIIISLLINSIDYQALFNLITDKPSIWFFTLGAIGMTLMLIFGFVLDGKKSKHNWIEQITNALAQLAILIGIILLK